MLTQDELKAVGDGWSAMTDEQKDAVRVRVQRLRQRAKESSPFKVSILRTWQENSESICEESDTWLFPVMFADGVQWAIEGALLEWLFSSPEVVAWEAAHIHVETAIADAAVSGSALVRGMFEDILDVINDSADGPAYEGQGVWDWMVSSESLKRAKSAHGRMAALSKNAKPRAWVLNQWNERTDQGQSKASFARQYAALVKRRFKVDVTPEQISREWLPKG